MTLEDSRNTREVVAVRFSEAEREAVAAAARSRGMRLSAFIRQAAVWAAEVVEEAEAASAPGKEFVVDMRPAPQSEGLHWL